MQLSRLLFRICMTTKLRNINCSALPKILLNQKNISGKNAPNNLYDPVKYPKKWQEHLLQVHPSLPPPRTDDKYNGWQIYPTTPPLWWIVKKGPRNDQNGLKKRSKRKSKKYSKKWSKSLMSSICPKGHLSISHLNNPHLMLLISHGL